MEVECCVLGLRASATERVADAAAREGHRDLARIGYERAAALSEQAERAEASAEGLPTGTEA